MKRILNCLPLCFALIALPALSSPDVPAHGRMACDAAEPAADVSMMTRHAVLKSAAEAAIAGQAQTPCRSDKRAGRDRHASHAADRTHERSTHRHASARMCTAAQPAAALIALPELMAHRGLGTARAPLAPLAPLADATPVSQPQPGNAHC